MTLLTALTLSLAPQMPTPALDVAATTRLAQPGERPVLYDRPGDGELWALGANWKASFGTDGVLYVPITPEDVTPTPVRFQLDSATLGGRELAISEPTSVERTGDAVTLDRGSVRETWNLAPFAAEQTFVFDELPESGDLVLSVDLDTELSRRRDGRALMLESAHGAVRYGKAIAFDGKGHTIDVERTPTDNGFELRVSANFLAGAELPLVVDPIVSNTFTIAASTRPQRRPDAAYGLALSSSGSESVYLVVWEEPAGGLDVDVLSAFVSESGGVVPGSVRAIDSTADTCRRPKVAYNRSEETFYTVYERRVPSSNFFHIHGRRRLIGQNSMYFGGVISATGTTSRSNPDIGGHDTGLSPSNNNFTVVWEEHNGADWDVKGRQLLPTGGQASPIFDVAAGPANDRLPDVSRGSGVQFFGFFWHNMVWTRELGSPSSTVLARRITADGTAMTGETTISVFAGAYGPKASETMSEPVMADGSLPFVAVFKQPFPSGEVLYSQQVGNAGAEGGTNVTHKEGLEQPLDALGLGIAGIGKGAAIPYTANVNNSLTLHISTGKLSYAVSNNTHVFGLGERAITVADDLSGETDFALASRAEGGSAFGQGAIFWSSNGIIQGAYYEGPGAYTSPILGVQSCNAIVNTTGERGWVAAFGYPTVTGSKTLRAEDLPANEFGYLLVGDNPASFLPPASDGRLCVTGNLGRYISQVQASTSAGTMSFTIDSTAIPQPNGTIAAVPGENYYFQVWHRDGQTSNFTNALQISFE